MRRKTLMIRHHMLRAALFLLLLVSPIGAPALGIFITAACSNDVAETADGPFAMGFSRCGLQLPIERKRVVLGKRVDASVALGGRAISVKTNCKPKIYTD